MAEILDTYSMKRFTFYPLSTRVVKQIFSKNYGKNPMLGAYFEDWDGIGTRRREKLHAIVLSQNHETVHAIAAAAHLGIDGTGAASMSSRMQEPQTAVPYGMMRTARGTTNLS